MQRLAVVTGASSGIGEQFARQLAQRGHDLLLVARRAHKLQQLAAELASAHGVRVEALPVDLSSATELEQLAVRLASEEVAVLVNNAGFGVVGRFFETDLEHHLRMVRVHVEATVRLTHAVLPRMLARDTGAVVNVSSVGAYLAMVGNAIYGATKAFLTSFTSSLDLDLASRGSHVRVQALCPGFTRTEFHADMQDDIARLPRWSWHAADRVVAASLRGLDRGQVVVVPGWGYRLVVALLAVIPLGLTRRLGLLLTGASSNETK